MGRPPKYGNTEVDGSTITTIGFTPEVGYLITNNLALGAGLGLKNTSTKEEDGGSTYITSTTTTYFIPGLTYYF